MRRSRYQIVGLISKRIIAKPRLFICKRKFDQRSKLHIDRPMGKLASFQIHKCSICVRLLFAFCSLRHGPKHYGKGTRETCKNGNVNQCKSINPNSEP